MKCYFHKKIIRKLPNKTVVLIKILDSMFANRMVIRRCFKTTTTKRHL